MNQQGPIYLGIDIGGTKVAAGLVSGTGEVLYKTRVPMSASGDALAGFQAVKLAIDETRHANPNATIAAIGICSPGPLDPRTGVVINPPNLPCWRNFPLADEVTRAYGLPARVWTMMRMPRDSPRRSGARLEDLPTFSMPPSAPGSRTGIVPNGRTHHGTHRGCGRRLAHVDRLSRCSLRMRETWMHRSACLRPGVLPSAPARWSPKPPEIPKCWSWRRATLGQSRRRWLPKPGARAIHWQPKCCADRRSAHHIARQCHRRARARCDGRWRRRGEVISSWFPHISELLPKWSINQRCGEIEL